MVRLLSRNDGSAACSVAAAVLALRQGGIVAYPTDTLYGLAVDPCRPDAVERLYRAKGRPAERATPLIASSVEQLELASGGLPDWARRVAGACWPGPLTLVVPAWRSLAEGIHAGTGTVAVRVPALDAARALADAFGGPITSTSANRSGEPPTADPDVVATALGGELAVLLDGGLSPGGPPSTIVAMAGDGLRLVRAGAVAFDRVLECLKSLPSPGVTS
jgi:L-threonylcarbamoyladenylate synthase